MLRFLTTILCTLTLGTAFASAKPDTALTIHDSSPACMSFDEFEALNRAVAQAFISDCIEGTDYCVSWKGADSVSLAAAHLSTEVPDSQGLVIGSRIRVFAAVLDTGSTPSPPVVSEWNTVLGSGELPMALEWVPFTAGWFGSYTIQAGPELLKGLRIGTAHPGWSGLTILLTAAARDSGLEAGPNGVFENVRRAVNLQRDNPEETARLMDLCVSRWNPPHALRCFYARALGRVGRCADQLAQTRLLAADNLADSAFAEHCSEGYCYFYVNDFEAQADWSYRHAAGPPVHGDCVEQLWKLAIERVLNDQRGLGEARVLAFMKQQEARLGSLPDDDRFASCRSLVAGWSSADRKGDR